MTGTAQDRILRSRRSVGAVSQILFVAVLGAAIGLGFWARNQTFTATVHGAGVVSAVAPPVRVLSDISGTIATHEIEPGQRVVEGQFLFSVQSVAEEVEQQAAAPVPKALRAEIARLAAEAEGRRSIAFPADIADGTEAKAESAVFEERQATLERQQRALRARAR